MLENRQTDRKDAPEVIVPTTEREAADYFVKAARSMDEETKKFALAFMRGMAFERARAAEAQRRA